MGKRNIQVHVRLDAQEHGLLREVGAENDAEAIRTLIKEYREQRRLGVLLDGILEKRLKAQQDQIQTLREELRDGLDETVKRIGRGVAGLLQKHFS